MIEILEAVGQVLAWVYMVAMPTVLEVWIPAVLMFLWNLTPASWPGPARLLIFPLALFLLSFTMRRVRLFIRRLRQP